MARAEAAVGAAEAAFLLFSQSIYKREPVASHRYIYICIVARNVADAYRGGLSNSNSNNNSSNNVIGQLPSVDIIGLRSLPPTEISNPFAAANPLERVAVNVAAVALSTKMLFAF